MSSSQPKCAYQVDCMDGFFCDFNHGYCEPCSKFCFEEPTRCASLCPGFTAATVPTFSSTQANTTAGNKIADQSYNSDLVIILLVVSITLLISIIIIVLRVIRKTMCKQNGQLRRHSYDSHSLDVAVNGNESSEPASRSQSDYTETLLGVNFVTSVSSAHSSFSNPLYFEESCHEISSSLHTKASSIVLRKKFRNQSSSQTQTEGDMLSVQEPEPPRPPLPIVPTADQDTLISSTERESRMVKPEDTTSPGAYSPQTWVKQTIPSHTLDSVPPDFTIHLSTGETHGNSVISPPDDRVEGLFGQVSPSHASQYTSSSPTLHRSSDQTPLRPILVHDNDIGGHLVSLQESVPGRTEPKSEALGLGDSDERCVSIRHSRLGTQPQPVPGIEKSGQTNTKDTLTRRVSHTEGERGVPSRSPVQVAESLPHEDTYHENGLHVIELPETGEISEETLEKEPVGLSFPQQEVSPLQPGFVNVNPHVHPNRRIYELLKRIHWVLGYYSEGREIEVYIDYNEISQEMALKELVRITKEKPEKFIIRQNNGGSGNKGSNQVR